MVLFLASSPIGGSTGAALAAPHGLLATVLAAQAAGSLSTVVAAFGVLASRRADAWHQRLVSTHLYEAKVW